MPNGFSNDENSSIPQFHRVEALNKHPGFSETVLFQHTPHSNPSQSCREVLQAPSKNAGKFFYKTWKIQGPTMHGKQMETFCRITMQLSLFKLKLKTFPLLHHRDHFVFTRKFLKKLPYVNTISKIAR